MNTDIDKTNVKISTAILQMKEITDNIMKHPDAPLDENLIKAYMLVTTSAIMGLHLLVNKELQIKNN